MITSSQEVGDRLGCEPTLIRKDLSRIGRLGRRGAGYRVDELKATLGRILG